MNLIKNIVKSAATIFTLANVAFCSCAKNEKTVTPVPPAVTDTGELKPALTGRLVYHRYSCYGCNDSKIYLYDFSTNVNEIVSNGWNIDNPMNAHFSPDGTKITFMGLQSGTANWDIFLWTIGSATQPVNLTAILGNSRDEDPKFSNAGNRIVFKHNGHISEMDLSGNIVRNITSVTGEQSMPYYSYNDSLILYAEGGGAASDIFATNGVSSYRIAGLASVQEYYPVAKDSASFFYSRWNSAANQNDQLYLGFYNTALATRRLPFNTADANYSDACPCGTKYVFLSSTKSDSKGGYDLYIANIITGKIWPLSLYNAGINSVNEELGASYNNR